MLEKRKINPAWLTASLFLLLPFLGSFAHALTVTCPKGWLGYSESTSCYSFDERKRNFNDARLACQNYGGDLATIIEKKEKDFITATIGRLGDLENNSEWWIGVVYYTNQFQWVDGSKIDSDVITWAKDHPKVKDNNYTGALQYDASIIEEERTGLKNFVCKVSLGTPMECDEGWESFRASCYKVGHQTIFDTASDICEKTYYSSLIVVNNEEESDYVANLAKRFRETFWLGVHEDPNDTDPHMIWVDGTPDGLGSVFDNWDQNEPTFLGGESLVAGFVSVNSGKWSTDHMLSNSHSFVCEKKKGDFCPFDTIEYNHNCYDFNLDQKIDWDSGVSLCHEQGMELISVETREENEWLNKQLYDTELFSRGNIDGMWIGYSETAANSKIFRRTSDRALLREDDASQNVYDATKDSIEYNAYDLDCLFLSVCDESGGGECAFSSSEDKRWGSDTCTGINGSGDVHIVGCEIPTGESLNVTTHAKEYCPSSYLQEPFAGHCYQFKQVEHRWDEARDVCSSTVGAGLVSVTSLHENSFLLEQVKQQLGQDVWIGLSDTLEGGIWQWADQITDVHFTAWQASQPNASAVHAQCVLMDHNDGGWKVGECGALNLFVCKTPSLYQPDDDGPATPPTPPPINDNCGGHGWVENPSTGMCYQVVEELVNWMSAKSECQRLDLASGGDGSGDLASIGSIEEQIYISTYLQTLKLDTSHWIGLNDRATEGGFEWSDFSPLSFINWAEDAPTLNAEEDCGVITLKPDGFGTWNDQDCLKERPSLCEKKGINYVAPTVPPPPKIKCREGWETHGEYCYYFATTVDHPKADNWTHANTLCAGLDPASMLASVKDEDVQTYFESKVNGDTYLGATDADQEGVWRWQEDGSEVNYTHWGEAYNEPNGGTSENCLEMIYTGDWNDVQCNPPTGGSGRDYICSVKKTVCDGDYQFYNGYCWFVANTDNQLMAGGRESCRAGMTNADLASIHSDMENEFVTRLVSQANRGKAWIGLEGNDQEASWTWLDKSTWNYVAWKEGQPVFGNHFGVIDEAGQWESVGGGSYSKASACKAKPTHVAGCPIGWVLHEDYCYLVQREHLNWQKAEDSCLQRGGHLTSVNSYEEVKFLDTLIEQKECSGDWVKDDNTQMCYLVSTSMTTWELARDICSDADSTLAIPTDEQQTQFILNIVSHLSAWGVWIGGSDLVSEGHFKWENGQDVDGSDYSNWLSGEPNGGPTENCMDMMTNYQLRKGAWNDNVCSIDQYYVCQKEVGSSIMENGNKWIGLNDLHRPQTFSWSDFNPVTYTNWGNGHPSNHPGSGLDCVYMHGSITRWYGSPCDIQQASVCKRSKEIVPIADKHICGENQIPFEDSCYELFHQPMQFIEAEAKCEKNHGHLITIGSVTEQSEITSIVAQSKKTYHTGGKYDTYGMFSWVNGEGVYFTQWDSDQPDLSNSNSCVYLSNKEHHIANWRVGRCQDSRPFICEYLQPGVTEPPITKIPPTQVPPPPCPENWLAYSGHCYKLEEAAKGWAEAQMDCESYGAYLTVYSNNIEETETVRLANVPGTDTWSYWIGLKEDGNLIEGYEWVDNSPVYYVNFASNYPNSAEGTCVVNKVKPETSAWLNNNCNQELPYMCEMAAGTLPPTTPRPTPGPAVECEMFDGWYHEQGAMDFCYKVFEDAQKSWHEAKNRCIEEGGNLASIHSDIENEFISNLKGYYYADIWIGLTTKNEVDQYRWVDGTASDYFNWAALEPNDAMHMESCGSMMSSGEWNDAHCGKKNSFVCKKSYTDEPQTTPPPTAMPPGHCKEGYSEFQGHCFIIQGTLVEDRKDFEHAANFCRSLGPGHDLASVHSEKEMAHLITMMATWSDTHIESEEQNYWLGLTDTSTFSFNVEGKFMWIDESHLNYFNWAPNEPKNTYGDDCILMQGMGGTFEVGRWDDVWCFDSYPFICRAKADPSVPEPPSPPPKCTDSGYTSFDSFHGNCYTFVSNEKKTWNDAQEDCKSKNANLISIIDSVEQAYMMTYVEEKVWIGLNNKKHNETFTWTDDWPVDYINWGEEPNWNGDEMCVFFDTAIGGSWVTAQCNNEKLSYVCKYTSQPTPTPSYEGTCPEDWVDMPGPSCYIFSNTDYLQSKSWPDASYACLEMGGDLASIHSEEEMNMIRRELQKAVDPMSYSHDSNAWIGLALANDGLFHWRDSTPQDFENWMDGEPTSDNAEDVGEDCVEVYADSGKWNDVSCYTQNGYVCKRDKIPSPHSSPTPHETTTKKNENNSGENGNSGLSGGATAAIVIVCLMVISGSIAGVIYYKKPELVTLEKFHRWTQYKEKIHNSNEGIVNQMYHKEPVENVSGATEA